MTSVLDYEWLEILPFLSVTRNGLIFDDNLGFVAVHSATCFLNFNFVKRCEHTGRVNFDSEKVTCVRHS